MVSRKCATLISVAVALTHCGGAFAADEVTFSSAGVKFSVLRERLARQKGEVSPQSGTPLVGYLSYPLGNGPFPAVVVLHGCGGLGSRLRNDVAQRLLSQGYVVLVVDSFKTRQLTSTCRNTSSDDVFTITDRVYDAYGALEFLSRHPFVDAGRVALMGFSAGGVTALEATKFDGSEQLMTQKFRAAIAYYPTCSRTEDHATVPTLIMAGERDDWGPPERCRERFAHRGDKGADVRIAVYPGAFHDFDVPTAKPGTVYFGHRLEYNAQATEQSNQDLDNFLREQLGR